jgi:hypothetical protein
LIAVASAHSSGVTADGNAVSKQCALMRSHGLHSISIRRHIPAARRPHHQQVNTVAVV